jgi:DNA polymerase-3 subunit epsilon
MPSVFNPHFLESSHLNEIPFVVVDVETSGSKPLFHQIIEIGIVKLQHGEVTDQFHSFLNPGHPIPPDITMITGITDQDVADAPTFDQIAEKILPILNSGVFVAHNVQFDYGFVQKSLYVAGHRWFAPKLCTVQLSRKVLPHLPRHNLDALAQYFHIDIPHRHRALDDARATGMALRQMCQIMITNGISALTNVAKMLKPVQSDKYRHLKQTLDQIPYTPGVYYMKNKDDQIIYIGKSKCLHKRVRSYFYDQLDIPKKLERLVHEVHTIEWTSTGSELSALLLESQEIKKHMPIFNRMIRNYKAYPLLKFTNEPYPRLILTREIKADGASYYGPFKSSMEVKKLIDQLQKTFGIRPCKTKLNPKNPESFKTCLDVALGNCTGACTGKLSIQDYATSIQRAQNFLDGNGQNIIAKIAEQIDHASQNQEYEKAAELRDKLITLERLHQNRARIAQAVHQNNVVIIQPGNQKSAKEIFFLRNGILVQTISATVEPPQFSEDTTNEPHNSLKYWSEILSTIYDPNNQPLQPNKQNLDELLILATWLSQHQSPKDILYIHENHAEIASRLAELTPLLP